MQKHYRSCHLCKAMCGLEIETEGNQIIAVRGDKNDPWSQGFICPKGNALQDIHNDTSYFMFGNQVMFPIADIDRTDFGLILGGNPVVSNGSITSAPNMRRRIKAIRERGGQVVVVDPRRTETAVLATTHHPITPGGDVLLLAMLHIMFAKQRSQLE